MAVETTVIRLAALFLGLKERQRYKLWVLLITSLANLSSLCVHALQTHTELKTKLSQILSTVNWER